MSKIPVLNDGFVRLEYSAPEEPELMIVNAARVSYNKKVKEMSLSDEKLLEFLLKHRHGTPFEMAEFCFHIRCPIFVTREWHRHRIASYNEMSGRYVKLGMDFYTPEGKAIRVQKGKPGHYVMEPVESLFKLELITGIYSEAYSNAESAYQDLLDQGVAKEIARAVLPVGIYTEFYYKTNARSLMNFLSLRNDERAMLEIREYAKTIEDIFKEKMPITHNAFVKHGRTAP